MLVGLEGSLTPASLMAWTRLYRVVGIAGLRRAGVLLDHRELGAVSILPLRRDGIFVQESLFFHISRCKRLHIKTKKSNPSCQARFRFAPQDSRTTRGDLKIICRGVSCPSSCSSISSIAAWAIAS